MIHIGSLYYIISISTENSFANYLFHKYFPQRHNVFFADRHKLAEKNLEKKLKYFMVA